MRSRIILATVAAVALLVPATALGKNPETNAEQKYVRLYDKAFEVAGAEVGRNIVRDGYGKSYREPTPAEVKESIGRLDYIIHPPPPPPVVTAPTTTAPAPTTSSYSGGTDAVPTYISDCESGGDYGAYNPSSGATGKYQIIPSTAASYGCDLSTPAGQDACAAEIYADVGSSAWDCG